MGCGASASQSIHDYPKNDSNTKSKVSITEDLDPITKSKTYEAIKKDDMILLQKLLQDNKLYATEYIGPKNSGISCLHVAANYDSYGITEFFLQRTLVQEPKNYQKIINLQDQQGNTPPMICAYSLSDSSLLCYLEKGKIDYNLKNNSGMTLVQIINSYGSNKARALLTKYVPPNMQTVNSDSPNQPWNPMSFYKPVSDILESNVAAPITTNPIDNKPVIIAKPIKDQTLPININDHINEIKTKIKIKSSTHSKLISSDKYLQGIPPNSEVFKILTSCIQKNIHFIDDAFPNNVESICLDKNKTDYKSYCKAIWKRIGEITKNKEKTKLFDKVNPNDIKQGALGDCYFLAVLSGLAEYPSRLAKCISNQCYNPYGAYSVFIYDKGVRKEIIIDDYFPVDTSGNPLFAQINSDEFWVLVFEKAWAKYFGNYLITEGGIFCEAAENLLGSPGRYYFPKNVEELWRLVSQFELNNYIIGTSPRESQDNKKLGLVNEHAYTILGTYEVDKYRIIKVRNPWGTFEWKGAFSDNSPLWTDDIKRAVHYTSADDGIFCMTIEDFFKYFDSISVSLYKEGWYYTALKVMPSSRDSEYFELSVTHSTQINLRVHQTDTRFKNHTDCYRRVSFLVALKTQKGLMPICNINQSHCLIQSNTSLYIGEGEDRSAFGYRAIWMDNEPFITLEPGTYLIRVKIFWDTSIKEIGLSAYSEFPVSLCSVPSKNNKNFLEKWIIAQGAKAKMHNCGENCNFSAFWFKFWYFGFLLVNNNPNKSATFSIKLKDIKDMTIENLYREQKNEISVKLSPNSQKGIYLKAKNLDSSLNYNVSAEVINQRFDKILHILEHYENRNLFFIYQYIYKLL